jgi:leucyl/phenylalanyl-tRNA--protein transferase
MPIYRLIREHVFPPPEGADPSGIVAIGGDLHPDRVWLAYRSGIFPWYSEGEPLLWWSPEPRFGFRPSELEVQRSLAKRVRRGDYTITLDTAFSDVLRGCAGTRRPGQRGTWLTEDLQAAFRELHARGITHSAEAWRDGRLAGGLYGVVVGGMFCGESMFALEPDASKVAFVWLVRQLEAWGFGFIDCQVPTPHLARFGAYEISRATYLAHLEHLRAPRGPSGPWSFDHGFRPIGGDG